MSTKKRIVFFDRDGVILKAIVMDGKPRPAHSIAEYKALSGIIPGAKETVEAAAASDDRRQGKRVFADLNTGEDPALDEAVKTMGGLRFPLQEFGAENTSRTHLMRIKELVRSGRMIMMRAEVRPSHVKNIQWLTQVRRAAHRAGVPWTLRLKMPRP